VAEDLKKYNWKAPAILYGPPGCGKTALVQALAMRRDGTLSG